METPLHFRTKAIHVGNPTDPATGAVVPPIYVASTFVMEEAGKPQEYDYSRSGNPTRGNFETTIAALEGGVRGLAFSSGMAASHCATMLLETGQHIVAGTDIYGGTYRLLHKICSRSGITVSLVDTTDLANLDRVVRPETKMLWLESPGNPLMSLTNLRLAAQWAKQRGILTVVDNTFATPVLTRPLELGIDIVVHSATKYLGGHSDLLGGAMVVADPDLGQRLYYTQNATGGVMSPWDAFLASRGLKTLELRVREQCGSALTIANYLAEHPRVSRVLYPGLSSHPGHALATAQMDGGYGAMLSFEVAGDLTQAKRLVESTKLFRLAVSLGAVESLIEQPATMSHASYDRADRLKFGITDSLVRLSIGLEHPQDLIKDLDVALAGA
jgi:cystathionine gamma-lyase